MSLMRARFVTTTHFCEVIVLELRAVPAHRYPLSGFVFRVSVFGLRVWGTTTGDGSAERGPPGSDPRTAAACQRTGTLFRVSHSGFRISDSGFRLSGLKFRILD